MKFENIRVMNFENALRGMRNPKNSWHLSDSSFGLEHMDCIDYATDPVVNAYMEAGAEDAEQVNSYLLNNGIIYLQGDLCEFAFIGPKDMKLAKALIKGGPEHRKFMRQIFVSVDITAPLYWWKEFDTYKVGTVANSTSTMHKITSKEITRENFEMDDYTPVFPDPGYEDKDEQVSIDVQVDNIIEFLEDLRKKYLELKDTDPDRAYVYWKELIRWTPESWLQTRTVTMNYENLLAMCSKSQRRFHKLNEWSGRKDDSLDNFISFARELPYAADFIFLDEAEQE